MMLKYRQKGNWSQTGCVNGNHQNNNSIVFKTRKMSIAPPTMYNALGSTCISKPIYIYTRDGTLFKLFSQVRLKLYFGYRYTTPCMIIRI